MNKAKRKRLTRKHRRNDKRSKWSDGKMGHTNPAGRTGSVHRKKLASRRTP